MLIGLILGGVLLKGEGKERERETYREGGKMNMMTKLTTNGSSHGDRCVLVTGGAGYIGSHTALQLLLDGYKVVAMDNLSNSEEEAIRRVKELAGKNGRNLNFIKADMCDKEDFEKIFIAHRFDAVLHFAGVKAVGESVAKPLLYYSNNIVGTLNLLKLMGSYGCKKLVFSSSATVYGQPDSVPCTEDFPVRTMNPYGRTKLYIEEICRDLQISDPEWKIVLLRYFNPVGAHPSGVIGEDPRGIPNNLMPYMQQVAVGRRQEMVVFGNDYPTRDGTGVRDYIHVQDLATGHSAALDKISSSEKGCCIAYNLGSGHGTSVLEMIAAFEKACGKKIPVRITGRRPGDASEIYSAVQKAHEELGWKARYSIEDMCRDQWNWASKNPYGFNSQADLNESEVAPIPRETTGVVLTEAVST